jgi:hypothetical protein
MKFGAERNKLAFLGALLLVGAWQFYSNVLSGPDAAPAPARETSAGAPAPPAAAPSAPAAKMQPSIRRAGSRSRTAEEWHPSLKRRPEDQVDPLTIDPPLKFDLLAKVQAVSLDGGARNLFQFSTPPPPPAPKGPEPKIVPKIPGEAAAAAKAGGPDAGSPKPPPAPINLKYYGFSTTRGTARKTAFFLDGEDILVAGEGDTLKRRYRVVRIGVNSVVVEDSESKRQQTIPLVEEPGAPNVG